MGSERSGFGVLVGLSALIAAATAACADEQLRRFPRVEPLWTDPDRRPFVPKPEEYFSPFYWDAADYMVFRPISHFFLFEPGGEAINVNAMDEVPNSSWFENRIGIEPMSRETFVAGPCEGPAPDPSGPWTVTDAKPDGILQGFFMEDGQGRTYAMKFDGEVQQERATTADVVGSLFYHAAGYHVPCNRMVFFQPDVLQIAKDATTRGPEGDSVPLERSHLQELFAKVTRLPDGRVRALASLFVEGEPLGPFRYEGTREDDPNDVVPHQDRRDLRGSYVLASWINNFDSREANTLSTWIETGEDQGYVRHYILDFGESLGALWPRDDVSRRLGHTYFLSLAHLLQDFFTLGAIERPWHVVEMGPSGEQLGYFDLKTFEPDAWHNEYPNPAFERMTERDAAWMARIIAHISERHVVAAVEQAHVHNDVMRRQLLRTLLGRRRKILRRWFRHVSPLTGPQVLPDPEDARRSVLCLSDLAVRTGIWPRQKRPYQAVAHIPVRRRLEHEDWGKRLFLRHAGDVCLHLPPEVGSGRMPYLVLDIRGLYGEDDTRSGPARVHLARGGPREQRPRVVGLERPYPAER